MVNFTPPQFAGISVVGSKSALIGDVSAKDRRKWAVKEKDLLKFIIALLGDKVVQKRVFSEFTAEST